MQSLLAFGYHGGAIFGRLGALVLIFFVAWQCEDCIVASGLAAPPTAGPLLL